MMFLCRLGTRRQIGLLLRESQSVVNFAELFGLDSFPHGDTVNDALSRAFPEEFQEVLCSMVNCLIRKKVLYPYRVLDKYHIVAVDGTGTVIYSKRHCPHCLTQIQKGKTIYYHSVLEAKLVTPNGLALSLMTEFIENPGENPKKQDCEVKAFYRLAQKLKTRFPRLPILLSIDGIFAGGPTFGLCRAYNWKHMIVLKDKDLPSVNEEFEALCALESENRLSMRTGKKAEIKQDFRWVNYLLYTDSQKKELSLNVIECLETKPDGPDEEKVTKFKWITNLGVSASNVAALGNDAGRMRWKIENEGFNVQKNGGYGLKHAYTNDPTAAKNFYFLLQIAHAIGQLLVKGSLLRRVFPRGLGSAKNLAFRLLEAWRNARITRKAVDTISRSRFQIRFGWDTY